ncbi:protein PFC0760c-like [Oppia nitens]|uniref:protein PFC0760c-like n=1 Tax=Oppia nitens TaxID=1686743 RepID=UPI0023DA66BC|nr:protein PFC0760c-like [Oppia nitens]
MSSNKNSDTVWQEFLSSLYDDNTYRESEDNEEVSDPEFCISDEMLGMVDDWDFKDDRAIKVTDHELDLLLDEDNDTDMEVQSLPKVTIQTKSEITNNIFDEQSVKILVTQWSQHIQLLAQTYLQSVNMTSLESVAENAKKMLEEVKESSDLQTNCIYNSLNINPMVELITEYPSDRTSKLNLTMHSWRSLPVTAINKEIYLSNPHLFTYTWLLPNCGYYGTRVDKNNKTLFTLAEDHLIALGLEQLTPLYSLRQCYRYIRQLFVPNKTVDQIRTHIKNIKRRAKEEKDKNNCQYFQYRDNPIIVQSLTGKAPETHSGIIDPELDTYLQYKTPPQWYEKAIKMNKFNYDKLLTYEQTVDKNSDTLWQEFLTSIYDDNTYKESDDNEEANDPEFSISEEMLQMVDEWDSKDSLTSKLMTKSKKVVKTTQMPQKYSTQQQSPVKQCNSIVKKYKYLNNRVNPMKQILTNYKKLPLNQQNLLSNDQTIQDIELNSEDNILNNNKNSNNSNNNINEDAIEVSDVKENEKLNEIIDLVDEDGPEICVLNDNKEDNDNKDDIEKSSPIDNTVNEEDMEFDDESDLAALMTASSTITMKNKNKTKSISDVNNSCEQNSNRKEGRKSLLAVKQRESTLQLLAFDCNQSDPYAQQKEEVLIQNYLEKVRKCIPNEDFAKFLTLLSNFHQKRSESLNTRGFAKELCNEIEEIFNKSNVCNEIKSEFVLFLSANQAEECGKMFDFLYWKRFFNFARKLEIYSLNDSQCLQRLYRSLNQLKQNSENLDKNKIRSTVSRVLNGHSYLMHEFSSLILDEKPSDYLFEDEDFDEIVITSSDDEDMVDMSDNKCFETINIPDNDDETKYGTNECPCRSCPRGHTTHCISCSIRFIGGRVYVTQNHKKLGLAEIHFTDISDISSNKLSTISSIKSNDEMIEEDMTESDNELEIENNNNKELDNNNESKGWTLNDDKLLLDICRSRVIDERSNDLSEEFFEEVANNLSKSVAEVMQRFNKLMDLFSSEHEIS